MAVIKTTLGDGTNLLIEVETAKGLQKVGATDVIKNVKDAVDKAMQTVVSVANQFTSKLKDVQETITPNTASIQLGIKFGAEGSVVVAKASAEAAFWSITMTWTLRT